MEAMEEFVMEHDQGQTRENSRNVINRGCIKQIKQCLLLKKVLWLAFLTVVACLIIFFAYKYEDFKDDFKDLKDDFHNLKEQVNVQNPYLPYGPQIGIPLTRVISGGWINCYTENYISDYASDLNEIFEKFCHAPYLMIGCKEKQSRNLSVIAWAKRDQILTHTGNIKRYTYNTQLNMGLMLTDAHGTSWYFNNGSSMGFVKNGDEAESSRESGPGTCDVSTRNPSYRLCWPIEKSEKSKGYSLLFGHGGRCGSEMIYSSDWERMIFESYYF